MLKGGVAVTDDDDPLEQITLALDTIKFHSGECKRFKTYWGISLINVFPSQRSSIPENASAARSAPCHQAPAETCEECFFHADRSWPINPLFCYTWGSRCAPTWFSFTGSLCSQCVSSSATGTSFCSEWYDIYLTTWQPFDLTDLDWSVELWIAVHDDDEQNTRLARHVWDDNGLDVPEAFLGSLQVYLGKFTRTTRLVCT